MCQMVRQGRGPKLREAAHQRAAMGKKLAGISKLRRFDRFKSPTHEQVDDSTLFHTSWLGVSLSLCAVPALTLYAAAAFTSDFYDTSSVFDAMSGSRGEANGKWKTITSQQEIYGSKKVGLDLLCVAPGGCGFKQYAAPGDNWCSTPYLTETPDDQTCDGVSSEVVRAPAAHALSPAMHSSLPWCVLPAGTPPS